MKKPKKRNSPYKPALPKGEKPLTNQQRLLLQIAVREAGLNLLEGLRNLLTQQLTEDLKAGIARELAAVSKELYAV